MTADLLDLSPSAVDAFLARTIAAEGVPERVAERAGISVKEASDLVGNLDSEARLACRMLATLAPRRDERILEVGAGAGVLAAFLHEQGADLVAIEPLQEAFEAFAAVRDTLGDAVPPIEPLYAEQLDPAQHGPFDLIFSVNVLEHMHPKQRNLDAIAAVLAPGGRMIHTCPNYHVPYEPHYGYPLVPVRPALTGLIARRASREPAWRSLNWITTTDVRRLAQRHGLALTFEEGQLAAAVDRLTTDPEFARRQSGLVTVVVGVLDKLRLLRLLRRLPASWSTPMTFTLTRPR